MIITSRTNQHLKEIAALHQRKQREESGCAWVEGVRCIETVLGTTTEIKEVIVNSDARPQVHSLAERVRKTGATVVQMSSHCFEKCSVLRHPEGIGIVVAAPKRSPLPPDCTAPVAVLWQVQDPGNQGSIIRTAVGLGCQNIVVTEPSVDLFHPMCIRGSTGALFCANLFSVEEKQVYSWLKANTARVVGLTGDGNETLNDYSTCGTEIVVIGSEAHGLPEPVRKEFKTIQLPMENNVESLNVTAAAAIAMYTLWKSRQRQEKN